MCGSRSAKCLSPYFNVGIGNAAAGWVATTHAPPWQPAASTLKICNTNDCWRAYNQQHLREQEPSFCSSALSSVTRSADGSSCRHNVLYFPPPRPREPAARVSRHPANARSAPVLRSTQTGCG